MPIYECPSSLLENLSCVGDEGIKKEKKKVRTANSRGYVVCNLILRINSLVFSEGCIGRGQNFYMWKEWPVSIPFMRIYRA